MLPMRSLLSLAIMLLSKCHSHSLVLAFLFSHELTSFEAPFLSSAFCRSYSALASVARRILSVKNT